MMAQVEESKQTVDEMSEQFPRMQRKTNEIHREFRNMDDLTKT